MLNNSIKSELTLPVNITVMNIQYLRKTLPKIHVPYLPHQLTGRVYTLSAKSAGRLGGSLHTLNRKQDII